MKPWQVFDVPSISSNIRIRSGERQNLVDGRPDCVIHLPSDWRPITQSAEQHVDVEVQSASDGIGCAGHHIEPGANVPVFVPEDALEARGRLGEELAGNVHGRREKIQPHLENRAAHPGPENRAAWIHPGWRPGLYQEFRKSKVVGSTTSVPDPAGVVA